MNTGSVRRELLPVVSQVLGSTHHMQYEEGGGEEQHLVHRLPLSHVPSLQLSHSSLRPWEEVYDEQPKLTSPQADCVRSPAGGSLQLPVRR